MFSGKAYNCTVSGNFGLHGGGIYRGSATDCTIVGNSATNTGGGMFDGNLINCLVCSNSAYYGGGLASGTADLCVFTDNIAFWGGAVLDGTANNCMITENVAYYGGGMHSYWSEECTAANCTIVGNTAIFQAGGIGRGTVHNCIVYYNTSPNGANLSEIDASYTCSPDVTNGVAGNITNAPMLLWTSHIASNSPCRGAGSATYVTGADIDGEAWANPPSMGCDEPMGAATGALQVAISVDADAALTGYPVWFHADIEGIPSRLVWDFGAGSMVTNVLSPEHAWGVAGSQDIVLTVYNDTWPGGVSATQTVSIVAETNPTNSAIYVASSGNDTNNGSSWVTAKATIQAAIDEQYAGGLVLVGPGTYAGGIELGKGISVLGVDGPAATMVDGLGSGRCFEVDDTVCTISGLTIMNGSTDFNGGGIFCKGGNATVTNCIVTQSHAKWNGGGIAGCGAVSHCTIVSNTVGSVSFDHSYGGGVAGGLVDYCTVSGNRAQYGGGGMVDTEAEQCLITDNTAATLGGGIAFGIMANDCIISSNTALYGGGLYLCPANSCTIISNSATHAGGMYLGEANYCTISGNTATDYGGGMRHATANHCVITGNTSDKWGGGAVECTVNNSMISGNWASYFAGGMYYGTANNCTISGNSAANNAGGAYGTKAYNCIVWYNESLNKSNFSSGGSARYSCSPDLPQGVRHNTTNAPGFVDYANGDYRLMSNSPCINWGDNSYVSNAVDFAGNPRVAGGYVDMGAYEFQGTPAPDRDGDGMDDAWERDTFGYNADPADNADGDVYNNGDEFTAGTDPTNAASFFAVSNAFPSVGFVVEWNAVTGRWYKVLWTDNLTNSYQSIADNLEYPQSSYTDTVHSAESVGYYRVEVRMK